MAKDYIRHKRQIKYKETSSYVEVSFLNKRRDDIRNTGSDCVPSESYL